MKKEDEILERLDRLEALMTPMAKSAQSMNELKEELTPRINEMVRHVILELAEIDSDFQLSDLIGLGKNMLRNVKNLNYALNQLKNAIDLVDTAEPLMKITVPYYIARLDELERKGVFDLLRIGIGSLEKIAETYSKEELEDMTETMINMLGAVQKLGSPEATRFIEHMASIPCKVGDCDVQALGFTDLLRSLGDEDAKRGLAVLIRLTKAMAPDK